MELDLQYVTVVGLFVTPFVNWATNIVGIAFDLPRWGPLLVAFVLGQVFSFLVAFAAGIAITQQTGAQMVLAGVTALVGSVALNEIYKIKKSREAERDAGI